MSKINVVFFSINKKNPSKLSLEGFRDRFFLVFSGTPAVLKPWCTPIAGFRLPWDSRILAGMSGLGHRNKWNASRM